MNNTKSHYFTACDGAKLHYLQIGQGEPLLMIPGGGFSSKVFKFQIEEFCKYYQVIILDKRGSGKSKEVDYGYRVSRFAKDIDDLLTHLSLDNVNVLGHSQGAAVMYNYFDLFGSSRIRKLITVDQAPALLINPRWSQQQQLEYGAIYHAGDLYQQLNAFLADDIDELKYTIINSMTTTTATDSQKSFLVECFDTPGFALNLSYFNTICEDFRDVIARINIPTLFIGGKASSLPWQSQQWMHQQVPGSQVKIFEIDEGGSHFLFVENPKKFNKTVLDFLNQTK
ncbi:alpha/beta hydrolase [Francisella sp. LA112445]|uniref:alpha/beta fold hydrolase n=1 Tax=Francisella sp. LA112445 TaxID=1395624 RepID=UPI001788D1F1|nr:alpha/beta hydrolase [Francisella sp. LA112445]QIW10704.1 alpha/beta hydrolase [Francisella sp. LA112445]